MNAHTDAVVSVEAKHNDGEIKLQEMIAKDKGLKAHLHEGIEIVGNAKQQADQDCKLVLQSRTNDEHDWRMKLEARDRADIEVDRLKCVNKELSRDLEDAKQEIIRLDVVNVEVHQDAEKAQQRYNLLRASNAKIFHRAEAAQQKIDWLTVANTELSQAEEVAQDRIRGLVRLTSEMYDKELVHEGVNQIRDFIEQCCEKYNEQQNTIEVLRSAYDEITREYHKREEDVEKLSEDVRITRLAGEYFVGRTDQLEIDLNESRTSEQQAIEALEYERDVAKETKLRLEAAYYKVSADRQALIDRLKRARLSEDQVALGRETNEELTRELARKREVLRRSEQMQVREAREEVERKPKPKQKDLNDAVKSQAANDEEPKTGFENQANTTKTWGCQDWY